MTPSTQLVSLNMQQRQVNVKKYTALKNLKPSDHTKLNEYRRLLDKSGKQNIIEYLDRLLDVCQTTESFNNDIQSLLDLYKNNGKAIKQDAASLLIFCYDQFCHSELMPNLNENTLVNGNMYKKRAITLAMELANDGVPPAVFVQDRVAREANVYLLGIDPLKADSKLGAELIEFLSRHGNAEAQIFLGLAHESGRNPNIPRDEKRAFELFNLASQKNHPEAINRLVEYYMEGNVIRKSDALALEFCQKSIALGNAKSWITLATLYLGKGEGSVIDERRGIEILHSCAFYSPDNFLHGLEALGRSYMEGKGVSIDYHRAILLLLKANECVQNEYALVPEYLPVMLKPIDLNLNAAYQKAPDVPKDLNEAVKIYTALLDKDKEAESRLAFCHHFGLGTQVNLELAIEFYKKGIENNCPGLQWELFSCYQRCIDGRETIKRLGFIVPNIDVKDMLSWYESHVSHDAEANLILARIHSRGIVDINLQKSLSYLQKACELNPKLKEGAYGKDMDELSNITNLQKEILTFSYSSNVAASVFPNEISTIISEYALEPKMLLSLKHF